MARNEGSVYFCSSYLKSVNYVETGYDMRYVSVFHTPRVMYYTVEYYNNKYQLSPKKGRQA